EFWGQGHIADLGHPGVTARAAILEDQHAVLIDVEGIVVDASVKILNRFENHGPSAVLQQVWTRRRKLDHSAVGRKVSSQHGDASCRFERLSEAMNHIAVP